MNKEEEFRIRRQPCVCQEVTTTTTFTIRINPIAVVLIVLGFVAFVIWRSGT